MDEVITAKGVRSSHAYIISSPSEVAGDATALQLAASLLCEKGDVKPCGECAHCRKALRRIHPDLTVIEPETDDKGNRKREIYVAQIRQIVSGAHIMPNEAERKVYLIKQAELMNTSAQNALLKLLEEPPRSVAFILCTANPAALLPTVRSRCFTLRAAAPDEDGADLALAREFLSLVASGQRVPLLRWCTEHESMSALEAERFIDACLAALAEIFRSDAEPLLTRERAAELERLFRQCRRYLRQNIGTRHIFGLLNVSGIPTSL